jgi:hypothetical protein
MKLRVEKTHQFIFCDHGKRPWENAHAPLNLPIVETSFLFRKLFWANGQMGFKNIIKKI